MAGWHRTAASGIGHEGQPNMAALWDDLPEHRRTPRCRRRATVDGDDWAPPRRNTVNAGALAGKQGALADGHYDALLTVGVRRDAR